MGSVLPFDLVDTVSITGIQGSHRSHIPGSQNPSLKRNEDRALLVVSSQSHIGLFVLPVPSVGR